MQSEICQAFISYQFDDYVDVAVVTRGKNDMNTARFLTQTACFVS